VEVCTAVAYSEQAKESEAEYKKAQGWGQHRKKCTSPIGHVLESHSCNEHWIATNMKKSKSFNVVVL
jgi:hypothetical protein